MIVLYVIGYALAAGVVALGIYGLLSFVVSFAHGFAQGYCAERLPALPCYQLVMLDEGGYYYCLRDAGHTGPCCAKRA